ncbi:hypothetical protein MTP99_000315 [Tenebrio molitor]|jgi:hypothetical protein|nr:hypothetical protein MTP99_000315 [Tenebrio molitor]
MIEGIRPSPGALTLPLRRLVRLHLILRFMGDVGQFGDSDGDTASIWPSLISTWVIVIELCWGWDGASPLCVYHGSVPEDLDGLGSLQLAEYSCELAKLVILLIICCSADDAGTGEFVD